MQQDEAREVPSAVKGFRFRFERVLDVKRLREERCLLEVALAEKRRALALEELALLKRRLQAREAELRAFEGAPVPVERMVLLSESAALLREEIKRGEARVAEALMELERTKAAHAAAVKERKSLERLRDRRLETFREDLARAEQKEMDEMAQTVSREGAGRER